MVQVLRATPREKRKSFSERLNEGIASGLDIAESYILQNEKKKEDEALRTTAERLSGQDLSGVSGDVIRQSFGDILKQAGREKEQQTKIEGIRNAFKKGNPLRKNPSEQFAKNIVENTPRNQASEFAELNQPRNEQFNNQINDQNIPEEEFEFGDYKNILEVPDSVISHVRLIDKEYGKSLREAKDAALQERSYKERTQSQQEERDYQRGLKEREFHTSYSKDVVKKVENMRENLPRKEAALNLARNAVETGDPSFFSLDNLANVTGLGVFRTAKGAQLIAAAKENLISNLSQVSARAQNQWLEQKMSSVFPQIGQSEQANLSVQEMLEAEEALDKAYVNEFERVQEEDDKTFGYERKDIGKRVSNNLKPIQEHIARRTSYRLKQLEEQEKGLSSMEKQVGKNVIPGTPLTLEMATLYKKKFGDKAKEVAKKNGYYIPKSLDELNSYTSRPEEFRKEL